MASYGKWNRDYAACVKNAVNFLTVVYILKWIYRDVFIHCFPICECQRYKVKLLLRSVLYGPLGKAGPCTISSLSNASLYKSIIWVSLSDGPSFLLPEDREMSQPMTGLTYFVLRCLKKKNTSTLNNLLFLTVLKMPHIYRRN